MNMIIVDYIVQYTDLHHTVEGNPKTRHFDTEEEARTLMARELTGNVDIMGVSLIKQTSTIVREVI